MMNRIYDFETSFTKEQLEKIFTFEGRKTGGLSLSECVLIESMKTEDDVLIVEFQVHAEYIN